MVAAPGWSSDTTNLPFLFPSVLLRRKGERNQFSVVMQLVYFSVPLRSAGWNVFWEVQEGRREREGITGAEGRQNCKTGLQILPLPTGSCEQHPYGQQHASKITRVTKELLCLNCLSSGSSQCNGNAQTSSLDGRSNGAPSAWPDLLVWKANPHHRQGSKPFCWAGTRSSSR